MAAGAEVARLLAENARLRQQLSAEDGGVRAWGTALLADVKAEPADERRTFHLKSELCLAMKRRKQLETAIAARHAGLSRVFYDRSGSVLRPKAIELALADGAAEVHSSRMGCNMSVVQGPSADAALEVEQKIIELQPRLEKELPTFDRQRLDACASALLQNGVNFPPALPQRAALLRRKLDRCLNMQHRQGSIQTANGRKATSREAMPARPRPHGQLLEAKQSGVSAVSLPEGILAAWLAVLEASAGERSEKQAVEDMVKDMVHLVADWATQLQSMRVRQPPRVNVLDRTPATHAAAAATVAQQ